MYYRYDVASEFLLSNSCVEVSSRGQKHSMRIQICCFWSTKYLVSSELTADTSLLCCCFSNFLSPLKFVRWRFPAELRGGAKTAHGGDVLDKLRFDCSSAQSCKIVSTAYKLYPSCWYKKHKPSGTNKKRHLSIKPMPNFRKTSLLVWCGCIGGWKRALQEELGNENMHLAKSKAPLRGLLLDYAP